MNELPSQTIFYTIEKAIKEYRKFAQRNLKASVGDITIDQGLLLIFLNKYPDITQKKLGELIFKDNASITRMIELMCKKQYIERFVNKNDRRKHSLNITKKGKDILESLNTAVVNNRKEVLEGISEKEFIQLNTTLNKIINNCNNK